MDMAEAFDRHRSLAVTAAKIYWNRIQGYTWLGFDDLLQAGYIGILDGARNFDPEKGSERTYFWRAIYRTVQQEVLTNSHTLKVGVQFKVRASRIKASDDQDDVTLAKKLETSVAEITLMKRYLNTSFQSFDAPFDEEDESFTLYDLLPVKPEENLTEVWKSIDRACHNDKDRAVVRLLDQGYTYTEIAERIGSHAKSVDNRFTRIRRRWRMDGGCLAHEKATETAKPS